MIADHCKRTLDGTDGMLQVDFLAVGRRKSALSNQKGNAATFLVLEAGESCRWRQNGAQKRAMRCERGCFLFDRGGDGEQDDDIRLLTSRVAGA